MNSTANIDFQKLYSDAPCGYLYISPEGKILETNTQFLELTGFDRNEVIGNMEFQDFLSKAGKIFFETNYLPTLKMQGNIKEVNFKLNRKDQSTLHTLINSIEIKDENGMHLYTQTTVLDISYRKQYELQLLNAKKEAQELNNQLNATNKELRRKNNLLEGGIRYSKKIQYSILPAEEKILDVFNDLFIYFRPKGEIGGDFYWFSKKDNFAFIAVVDCTGHGVPGALMSMSVNAILNEIMLKDQSLDPGKILSLLHEKVTIMLQQKEGDEYSQDGCDIVLCRFDLSSKRMLYAGANSNLYIYYQGVIRTIEATKRPIGGMLFQDEVNQTREFTSQEVLCDDESLIIMTTDGILDQLNASDEPLYVNEFNSMVREINEKGVNKGTEVVECSLGNWMKDSPQLDDILLMGFKIDGSKA